MRSEEPLVSQARNGASASGITVKGISGPRYDRVRQCGAADALNQVRVEKREGRGLISIGTTERSRVAMQNDNQQWRRTAGKAAVPDSAQRSGAGLADRLENRHFQSVRTLPEKKTDRFGAFGIGDVERATRRFSKKGIGSYSCTASEANGFL